MPDETQISTPGTSPTFPTSTSPVGTQGEVTTLPRTKAGNKMILVAFVLVVLIVGGLAAIYFVTSKTKEPLVKSGGSIYQTANLAGVDTGTVLGVVAKSVFKDRTIWSIHFNLPFEFGEGQFYQAWINQPGKTDHTPIGSFIRKDDGSYYLKVELPTITDKIRVTVSRETNIDQAIETPLMFANFE